MTTSSGLKGALVDAALRFLRTEEELPSLRAVARAAGVSAMAPYRHFQDKAELMSAVSSRGFEILRDDLASADGAESDPHEALFAQGMAFIGFARANPALFRLMYGEQYGRANVGAVRDSYDVLFERVRSIVGDRAVAATLACRGLVQGIATIELNKRLTPAEKADIEVAVRLLVYGLKAATR